MADEATLELPLPKLDALPWGAHRSFMLTDEALAHAIGVRLAFTGRSGGVSQEPFSSLNCGSAVGDETSSVAENRRRVLEALGAPDATLVVPTQVHGTEVLLASAPCADAGEADAVIVEEPGIAALLNFADCLPLILVAPTGAFAVVHCGWRGTVAHLAAKVASTLARRASVEPEALNAYIGPHIRQECFEVGSEVAERFVEEFDGSVVASEDPVLSKAHVSLEDAVTLDLLSVGLVRPRILSAGVCTVCASDEYFSYRATGGQCGRHCACAVLMD